MSTNSNITQELLETVERYYNHTMTADERTVFEEKLQQDTEFKTLVEDIKTLILGIETQTLKEKLDTFHNDMPMQLHAEKAASKVRYFNVRKIAATVVILVAIGCFWWINGSSNDRLYNQFFTPDPGLPTTMSKSDNFEFFDAMVNYKKGDYKLAITKWNKLQEKEPDNDTINYFLGVANLADNNTNAAISFLQKTASRPESVFHDDAEYYLGLAHLKNNNKQEAIKFLKLSNTETSKKLLEKLD